MQMFLEFWGILEERVPSWIGLDYHSISNDIFLPTFKPRLRKDSFIFPNIASSPHHCETMAAFKSIHYDSSVNDASMPAPNLVWRLKNSVAVGCRGKVMSQGANKLQEPFLANSIYSRSLISKMSINSC